MTHDDLDDTIFPITLRVVNESLGEHLEEDALLRKFTTQFQLDRREQMHDIDDVFILHIENSVAAVHRNGKHLWFIMRGEEVIGFTTVVFQVWPVRNSVYISDFYIDRPWRGNGYGREALRQTIEALFQYYPRAERVGLQVLTANTVAKSLYIDIGFKPQLETMVLEKVSHVVRREFDNLKKGDQ